MVTATAVNHQTGGEMVLLDLKQLKLTWKSPLEAWKDAYAHEQFITAKIHNLIKTARKENDYTAQPMLAWFANEQIEEESNTDRGGPADRNGRRQQGGNLHAGP